LTLASNSELLPNHSAPLKMCQKWRPAIHESTQDRDTFAQPVAANAASSKPEAGIRSLSPTLISSQNWLNRRSPAP
jgi:hypothetical protein